MTFFLIGSGAAVYFDLGGSKDKLAQILGIYSRVEAREAQAASRESEADKLKESLAAVQTAQEKEKASLEKQAADIEKSKAELEEERKQFKEQKLTDEQRQAELEKMGQALGQMDAAKAADIITKLGDTDQMVFLVRQLTPESSAQVLANMQPDLAAKILQKMISG
jgi:flagellar motility protein MotE (MotC chaperone)